MVTVEFPVEVGNRYRDDPSMRQELAARFERVQPESLDVGLMQRVIYMCVRGATRHGDRRLTAVGRQRRLPMRRRRSGIEAKVVPPAAMAPMPRSTEMRPCLAQ